MGAKRILLLLDHDRLAYPLIEYLARHSKPYAWKVRIGGMFDPQLANEIRKESFAADLEYINITKIQDCDQAIRKSDIVIGLVSDTLLLQVADSCTKHAKTLISPARLTRQMALKKTLAKEKNVLILMDCGFSPGLDHIIIKKAIDNIHSRGGKIKSLKTYSGTFAEDSCLDNPWKFKLTEPVTEILNWGKHNNRHLLCGRMQHIPYHQLFERSEPITIRDLDGTVVLPEGDSLYYKKIYSLMDADTVVKGKLIGTEFERMWKLMIRLGMTDTNTKIEHGGGSTLYDVLDSLLPYSDSETMEKRLQDYTGANATDIENIAWLGLFDQTRSTEAIRELTPAQLLQQLMERKFAIEPDDRDCAVMEHHVAYELRDEHYEFVATFTLQGENQKASARAKVAGYICGAAVKSVLAGLITCKGVHIPVTRDIYDPILNELEEAGIAFHITDNQVKTSEIPASV